MTPDNPKTLSPTTSLTPTTSTTDEVQTNVSLSGDTNIDHTKFPEKSDPLLEENHPQISKGPPWYRSKRYVLAYILCGGFMNVVFQRNNMNIAIVCMVNHTATDTRTGDSLTAEVNTTLAYSIENLSTMRSRDETVRRQNMTWSAFKFHREFMKALGVDKQNSTFNEFDVIENVVGERRISTDGISEVHNAEHGESNLNVLLSISHHDVYNITNDKVHHVSSGMVEGNIKLSSESGKTENNLSESKTAISNAEIEDQPSPHTLREENSCSVVSKDSDEKEEDGPLRWDKQTQGLVLGAIYWTFSAMSLPSNAIVRNISKKRVIAVSISVLSIISMFIPLTALWSPWAVIALKLIQGVCSALATMTMYGFWGRWAPPNERSGLVSLSIAGSIIGNAIVFPISGFLCKYGFLGGWPSVFYVFGVIGILWVFVFVFFIAETPALHSSITTEERKYIESSLPSMNLVSKTPSTPWRSVLTSIPVWAFICQHLSYTYGLFFITTTGPQYMKEVLKFRVDSNGIYNMLPYLLQYFIVIVSGQAINSILKRKLVRLIWIRRVGSVLGNIVPALLLLLLGFLDCTQATLAVSLLTLAVGMAGINVNVFVLNPYDLAPQFSQSIMTFSNTLAVANGILAPYAVAAITKDKTTSQWQTVLFMTSAILVVGTVVYCILGKADVQSWAMPKMELDVVADEADSTNVFLTAHVEDKTEDFQNKHIS